MKIIFLSTCYPRKNNPSNGIFIHEQAKALKELGAEVYVIQPINWFPPMGLHKLHPYWRQGYQASAEMNDEVEGIPVLHPRMFIKMPTRFFFMDGWERMGRTVGRFIKRTKYLRDADWIYAHFLCYEGYAGTFASSITGIPLAAIARGDDVHDWPHRWPGLEEKLRVVFRKAQIVLANSKQLAKDAEVWFEEGFARPIYTVYNGVNTTKFHPVKNEETKTQIKIELGLEINTKYLLCVATPVVLKGWVELLDALKTLGDKFDGWKLAIISVKHKGVGVLDLVSEVALRHLSEHAAFIGMMHADRMPYVYQACDLFIVPSHNEGMSNALLESMASGLPVIATNVGGHKEVVDEFSGLLIRPKSSEELALAISAMINKSKAELTELGVNARNRMIMFGSYKKNASSLLDLLRAAEGTIVE